MSLTDRIAANACAVVACQRVRTKDAAVCCDHIIDLWMLRLVRAADGTYVPRRTFTARDETGRVSA